MVTYLSSNSEERRQAASDTLDELLSKMGDALLAKIVPILQQKLEDEDQSERQGALVALSELLRLAHKSQLAPYMQEIVGNLRSALCDSAKFVRSSAGAALETLYSNVGKKTVDDIIPPMLQSLMSKSPEEEDWSLVIEGMRIVIAIAGKDVLPYLIPALSKSPLSFVQAKALAALSDVLATGSGFHRYVNRLCVAFTDGIAANTDEKKSTALKDAATTLVLNITDDSAQTLLESLSAILYDSKKPKIRVACLQLLSAFCGGSKCDFESHMQLLIETVLPLFADSDVSILAEAIPATENVLKHVTKEKKESLFPNINLTRKTLNKLLFDRLTGTRKFKELSSLSAKAVAPIVNVYIEGLMHGSPDARELSAKAMSDLIEMTPVSSLTQVIVYKMVGPLIRVVGDLFSANVKSAILHTLAVFIGKSGALLKPFLSQLQTTFVKTLQHQDPSVRAKAIVALTALLKESKKVEPIINELLQTIKAQTTMREVMLEALNSVLGLFLCSSSLLFVRVVVVFFSLHSFFLSCFWLSHFFSSSSSLSSFLFPSSFFFPFLLP
jgi:HEAT repeat protein